MTQLLDKFRELPDYRKCKLFFLKNIDPLF